MHRLFTFYKRPSSITNPMNKCSFFAPGPSANSLSQGNQMALSFTRQWKQTSVVKTVRKRDLISSSSSTTSTTGSTTLQREFWPSQTIFELILLFTLFIQLFTFLSSTSHLSRCEGQRNFYAHKYEHGHNWRISPDLW